MTAASRTLATWIDRLVGGPDRPLSAAAAVVSVAGVTRFASSASLRSGPTDCPIDRRFDLASLTKPFVATLALALDQNDRLPLSTPIAEALPEAAAVCRPQGVLGDLLRHRSGLIPWLPFYALGRRPGRALLRAFEPDHWRARVGTYSDLGYILWRLAAERCCGESLEEMLRNAVLSPLALTGVETGPGSRPDVVRCRLDTLREVELAADLGYEIALRGAPKRGRPQDGNARFLGGLPGHAGLFGSARAVAALGCEWLAPTRVLDPVTVRRALAGAGPYALGFARRRVRGAAGSALGPAAFGHTGFTGGSLWIDPDARLVAVLLGHRWHAGCNLAPVRRRFHRLAVTLARAG